MKPSSWFKIIAACIVVWALSHGLREFLNGEEQRLNWKLPKPNVQEDGRAFRPLEKPTGIDYVKAELGRKLFMDTRLSKNDKISCHSCHDFNKGGADGRKLPIGLDGSLGSANSPSVFNSALNFKQFWNGRAADLAEQIAGPIHNPAEMGTSWPEIIEKLERDQPLKREFEIAFGTSVTQTSVVEAIVEFERSLITLNAPFDRYLGGDESALSEAERRGFKKFDQYGCVACHQGQNIGGNMFQTMGVAHDYFHERGGHLPSDEGRFLVTKNDQDRHVFKVPSLRNVELTAPYFHDGSEANLEVAIRKMGRYQLGRVLPDEDIQDIAAFLRSLTGEKPEILKKVSRYAIAPDQ